MTLEERVELLEEHAKILETAMNSQHESIMSLYGSLISHFRSVS